MANKVCKDFLKEKYFNSEEFEKQLKEYVEIINKAYPEYKAINLKDFEAIKRVDLDKKFMENQDKITMKIGFQYLIDLYLHYDFEGYDFREALDVVFDGLVNRRFNPENKYWDAYKFFIESYTDRLVKEGFIDYAKCNPEVMKEIFSQEINIAENSNKKYGDPVAYSEFSDAKEILYAALSTLTPREEKILRIRFGLETGKEETIEDVAKMFNTTREVIMSIESKALKKLRNPARTNALKDYSGYYYDFE